MTRAKAGDVREGRMAEGILARPRKTCSGWWILPGQPEVGTLMLNRTKSQCLSLLFLGSPVQLHAFPDS